MAGVVITKFANAAGTSLHDFVAGDGSYTAFLEGGEIGGQSPSSTDKTQQRDLLMPQWAGRSMTDRVTTIHYEVVETNHNATFRSLKAFYARDWYKDGTLEVYLHFTYDGTEYRARCVPQKIQRWAPFTRYFYLASVLLLDQHYESVTQTTTSSIEMSLANPEVATFTTGGTILSNRVRYLIAPFSDESTRDNGFGFFVTPVHRGPQAINGFSLDIFGSTGLDVPALSASNYMRSSGLDIEIYVNKRRVMHWPYDYDSRGYSSSACSVWIAATIPGGRFWRAAAAYSNSATEIRVREPLVSMPALPFYVMANVDATPEKILVTAYDAAKKTLTCVRGRKGTTAGTIAAAVKLWWTPIEIEVVSGNLSGTLQDFDYIDDDYKPMCIDTVTGSNNGRHYLAKFQEAIVSGKIHLCKPRPGSCRTRDLSKYRKRRDMYPNTIAWTSTPGSDSNPASKMSISYSKDGIKAGHPLMDLWEYWSPILIDKFGFHYTVTSDWPVPHEARLEVRTEDSEGNETLEDWYAVGSTDDDDDVVITPVTSVRAVRWQYRPYDPKEDTDSINIVAQEPADDIGFSITAGDGTKFYFNYDASETITVIRHSYQGGGTPDNLAQIGRPGNPARLVNAEGETLYIHGLVLNSGDQPLIINCETMSITDAHGVPIGNVFSGVIPRLVPGEKDISLYLPINGGLYSVPPAGYGMQLIYRTLVV